MPGGRPTSPRHTATAPDTKAGQESGCVPTYLPTGGLTSGDRASKARTDPSVTSPVAHARHVAERFQGHTQNLNLLYGQP